MIKNLFDCESLSKAFLATSLFSSVIVLNSSLFPFVFPKLVFFRVTVELALLFLILHWVANPDVYRKKMRVIAGQPLFWSVTVFAAVYLIAGAAGINPYNSFWSNFERGDGGFQMLHYYAFFIMLALLFGLSEWRNLFRIFLVFASLSVFYGIGAFFKISGFIHPLSERFEGAFGNPAYLAAFLLFALFYAEYMYFDKNTGGKEKKVLTALIAAIFISFLLTATRGAFIGLFVAVMAFIAYLAYLVPEFRKRAVLYALAVVVSVFAAALAFRAINPGAKIFSAVRQTALQERIFNWESAWKSFAERPLLGWGPENFLTATERHFDTRQYSPDKQPLLFFDKAHNVFLDYLAETGLAGFFSYLWMIAAFYFSLLKFGKKTSEMENARRETSESFQEALMFALPAGYVAQGFFLFDGFYAYLPLFMFLSFSLGKFSGDEQKSDAQHAKNKYIPKSAFFYARNMFIGIAAIGLLFYGSLVPFYKSSLAASINREKMHDWPIMEDIAYFKAALDYPSVIGQKESIYLVLLFMDEAMHDNKISAGDGDNFLTFAENNVEPRFYGNNGSFASNNVLILGFARFYHDAGDIYGKREYYDRAEKFYKLGLENNPYRPQFLYGLMQVYISEKRHGDAVKIADRILRFWPDDEYVAKLMNGYADKNKK